MDAPFPDKKSAPDLSAPTRALDEQGDSIEASNRLQDRGRARRLLLLALQLLGEASDSMFHGSAEDCQLHAVRRAIEATHLAVEFSREAEAK